MFTWRVRAGWIRRHQPRCAPQAFGPQNRFPTRLSGPLGGSSGRPVLMSVTELGDRLEIRTSMEKSSRGAPSTTLMVSLLLGWTVANPAETVGQLTDQLGDVATLNAPKNFWLPVDSTTSTTPGRKASIEGTWLERIPMSPDSAGMFTWTTSCELKMVYDTS